MGDKLEVSFNYGDNCKAAVVGGLITPGVKEACSAFESQAAFIIKGFIYEKITQRCHIVDRRHVLDVCLCQSG